MALNKSKTTDNNKLYQSADFQRILREEAQRLIMKEATANKFTAWAVKYLKSNYPDLIPASVNVGNVTDFLGGSKMKLSPEEFEARKKIPVSHNSLLALYKNKSAGAASLEDDDEEEEDLDVATSADPAKKKKIYGSGEVPLEDIAGELGNITKMGVSKKIDDALGKLKNLGVGNDEAGVDLARIDSARKEGADAYIRLLAASRGNVGAFLKALEIAKLTKLSNDVGEVDATEKKAIKALYDTIQSSGADVAQEMLMSDIEENEPSERIWKTYQAVVARKAKLGKKAGRPAKASSTDEED